MSEEKPKICVECKWHELVPDQSPWEYQRHFCKYPRGDIDLVTGERTNTPPRLCRYARAADDDCSKEGLYWEKKE